MRRNLEMITSETEYKVLLKLSLPMMFGSLGRIIFNLVDTIFIGNLGTIELAAISFTFPVVMIISSIALGLGVGVTVAVSKVSGMGDSESKKGIISWGLLLAIIVVIVFVTIGLLTINPLFTLLGADDRTLPIINEYMKIWYLGVVFVVVPMVGNASIRGLGDTKTPAKVMLFSATINAILDPILIFGLGPCPSLGVKGAAIATVIARGITFIVTWYVLIFREKVINYKGDFNRIKSYLKQILQVGVPTAVTRIITPLSTAVITSIIATHGHEAVAGFGVSSRIEMFAIIPIFSLTNILAVFLGQNSGAKRIDRCIVGIKVTRKFLLFYGFFIYIVLMFTSTLLGKIFNDNLRVIEVVNIYFYIVPLSYFFRGLMLTSVAMLNLLNRSITATIFTALQMFLLYIPLAYIGSYLLGIVGVFSVQVISYIIVGVLSYRFSFNLLKEQ